MKKFLFFVLLLVVLVVGGLVTMVAMSFNPTAYEKGVISYLSHLTGREVTIGGTTSVTWNPVPTITLNNVRISNIDKSTNPTMLSIEKVQVKIAWDSLLKSPLTIKSIELTRPVLHLERLASNRTNFSFPFLLDPTFHLQETDLLDNNASKGSKIEEMLIKEGVVHYENQITGVTIEATNIDGTLSANTLRGPFRFNGTGAIGNGQYTLESKIGAFQGTSSVSVNAQLSEATTKTEMVISGNFTPTKNNRWFLGAVQFNIGRLDTFLNLLNLPAPEVAEKAKASGSSSIRIEPVTDILKDLVMQIGEGDNKVAFTGTLSRVTTGKLPQYTVDIATDQFKPEQWKSYLSGLNWNWVKDEENYPEITFKFMAKTMTLGNGILQDVVLDGKYEKGKLDIQKSSAKLPDGAKISFNAMGKMSKEEPTLVFGIRAEMPSVQGMTKWLLPDESWSVAPALAKKGVYAGRVTLAPDYIMMNFNEFKIGDTDVRGELRKNFADNGYILKLAFSNINLDEYTGWIPPKEPVLLSTVPALIKQSLEKATAGNAHPLQGTVDFQDVTVLGVPVGRVHLEGEWNGGLLKISSLTAQNMATANMTLAGVFNGVGRPQMNVDGLQMTLEAKQLPLLLNKLNVKSEIPLVQQATNTSFKLGLKGGRDGTWEVDTQAALSSANIKLSGVLEMVETNPSVQDMNFEIAHPNFQTFMKLIEPDFNQLPKLDGTFKMTGRISGSKEHFELADTTFGVGLQQLNGSLTFDNHDIKSLKAEISSPSVDVERFLAETGAVYSPIAGFSQKAWDLSALNNWNLDVKLNAAQLAYKDVNIRQAEVQAALQNKELTLVNLSGRSGTSDNSPIQIKGKLDWNTTPTLTGEFDIQNIPLRSDFMVLSDFAFGGSSLSVKGNLKARGASPAEFVQNLNGQGFISLRGGQMIGVDVDKMVPIITRAIQRNEGAKVIEPEFKRVLNSGKTALQSISGEYTIADGIIRMMDLNLETVNATANPTQVIWDIPKRAVEISIPVLLKPLNTLPAFVLGISAAANKGIYKPNYADLLAALSNQSQTALANDLQQKEEAARLASLQKRSDRIAESKRLTQEARLAVVAMENKIKEFPFEKGKRLLESAKDALTLVNQTAVREDPTDAQLIQQIEQARIVLLKAEEFDRALEQETLFSAGNQMKAYQTQSALMTGQLKAWAEAYPDIVILSRLADNAAQNQAIIDQAQKNLTPNTSAEQVNQILATCAEASSRIEKAYQHAKRFDLSAVPDQVNANAGAPIASEKKPLKGSFKKSGS